jgi:hypothetical protein
MTSVAGLISPPRTGRTIGMTMGDRIKTPGQERAEVHGGVHAVRQELAQLNERMAVIKQEAAVEVDRKWVSPWRTPEVFDLKVKTRLTSHDEYRSLQERVRNAKAALARFDAAEEAGTAK